MSLTKVSYSMIKGALVNVLDFGATGDGITDDTLAIQAALDSAITGTVFFPTGTYLTGQLTPPVGTSLVGSGLSSTTIKLKNNANPTAIILTPNFASLTGTTSLGGTFNSQISDLTIDGNKANNTSGYGICLYGKSFRIINVRVQNAKQIGIYTEYQGGDDFTTPLKNLEPTLLNVSTILCDGDGMVNKGPHDAVVTNFISYGNGGWGWKVYKAVNASLVNTFVNVSGGIFVGKDGIYSGVINGSEIVGSSGTGWGCLLESGGNNISAGSFAGPIGLEIQANNNTINGVVANSAIGVKFNGASSNARLDLTMFNNVLWFDVLNIGTTSSYVVVYGDDSTGTRQNSTLKGTWIFSGKSSNSNQVNGEFIVIGGRLRPPITDYTVNACGLFYSTGIPTSGNFLRGDRIFNTLPSVGASKGWLCTVAGTPGTWVSEGNL